VLELRADGDLLVGELAETGRAAVGLTLRR